MKRAGVFQILAVALLCALVMLVLGACGSSVYNVNFTVDGEIYATVKSGGGESIDMPDEPVKEGFVFEGWYWNCGGECIFSADSLLNEALTSDVSVYAKWREETVHVHVSSEWLIESSATCAEEGIQFKKCIECGEITERVKTDKLTYHTPAEAVRENVVEPTCKNAGSYNSVIYCTVCGVKLSSEVLKLEVKEHTAVTDPAILPTFTETGVTEGSHCSECGEVLVAQTELPKRAAKATLTSDSLNVDGTSITARFRNSVNVIEFFSSISVSENASWFVSRDPEGTVKLSKNGESLSEGENLFYIHVTNPDGSIGVYTVAIYRNRIYTVSFYTDGSYVMDQRVEEGSFAERPEDPTRVGYCFVKWDYDFAKAISSDLLISASWTAATDTPYKVEHYIQNVTMNGYTLEQVSPLSGTTGSTVSAEPISIPHFTFAENMGTLTGEIEADGSLVLRVYYKRNTYSVSSPHGSYSGASQYAYNATVSIELLSEHPGYRFIGWYSGETLLCQTRRFSFNIDKNVEAKFEVIPEMQNYIFESNVNYCRIDGIKDKTVTALTIPIYVTDISEGALSGCSALRELTLPFVGARRALGTLYEQYPFGYIFGKDAYDGSVATTQTFYHRYPTSLEDETYYIPEGLTSVAVLDGDILRGAFSECSGLENVRIGSGVGTIGIYAFKNCTALTELSLGSGVRAVDAYAFSGCTALTELEVPISVDYVGDGAFSGCSALREISIPFVGHKVREESDTNHYTFGYIFGDKSYEGGVKVTQYYTDEDGFLTSDVYYVPSSLKSVTVERGDLPAGAFSGCNMLENITLPHGITSVEDYAFHKCSALLEIEIEDGVNYIGAHAFSDCETLAEIDIPESVERIGEYAFSGCTGISFVFIPEGVISIGEFAFEDCEMLSEISVSGDNTAYKSVDGSLYTKDGSTLIRYPIGKQDKILIIPSGVVSIGGAALHFAKNLTHVEIPDSAVNIGEYAFAHCYSLESLVIPSGVERIERYAFAYCSDITSITLGESLESIGDHAFFGCYRAVEVIDHSFITSEPGAEIGMVTDYAFEIHTGESRISKVDGFVFYSYEDVNYLVGYTGDKTELVLPKSFMEENYKINRYAFYQCYDIISISISEGVSDIGDYAFSVCLSLECVIIGTNVERIGNFVFESCEALSEIKYRGSSEEWDAVTKSMYWNHLTIADTIGCEVSFDYTDE